MVRKRAPRMSIGRRGSGSRVWKKGSRYRLMLIGIWISLRS